MSSKGFESEQLSREEIEHFKNLALQARGDILKMTTLASSGHPGGSMSSIDMYLLLYKYANVDPTNPYMAERDRIVISHGHTSPGVYAALARAGFFDIDTVVANFRKAGSIFEGHVERDVPGIEWSSGNLGQGLSAACGFALAGRILRQDYDVFVLMGDGEQQKGQISEARRFARKYCLSNITVIVDHNRLQISGSTKSVMPQNIRDNFLADGWEVIEADGHDLPQLYQVIRRAVKEKDTPVVIIAHTVMGKGVSFMEDKAEFHGKALTREQYGKAIRELGLKDDLERYEELRSKENLAEPSFPTPQPPINIDAGGPHIYGATDKTDNRSAFGRVLKDLFQLNCGVAGNSPVAVVDCDLASSVKTGDFASLCPDHFFQYGIQEHSAATTAGALSTQGIVTFFADFGVFGVDETYNQHRLNDINHTNLKLVCTHNGLDVGEDGKTHQCIDYIGVLRNLYGYRSIVPADPNQTDRVIRYVARTHGNFFVGMGRSKLPTVLTTEGDPFFGGDYQFVYGKADRVREGNEAAIIAMGTLFSRAVQAWEHLAEKGFKVLLLNMSCLTDIDKEAVAEAARTGVVVTYEDHNVNTGLGALVASVIVEQGLQTKLYRLGVKHYAGSGKPEILFKLQGLDVESLVQTVLTGIKEKESLSLSGKSS